MMPPFQFSAFLAAALDFLLANQLAFWLVVLTACILAYECWLHAVRDAAIRRILIESKKSDDLERLREDLMKAIYRAKQG